ncbi:MAG: ATP-binding protein [Gemmatimonadaceae bacterium]
MHGYTPRIIDAELDELLSATSAVALEGPKGVGKTATCERRANTVFRLDVPEQRALAEADPAALVDAPTPILIDEWQHVPSVWDAVRRAVDRNATPNRFLMAGSAAPSRAPAHSGAGRILSVRMRPLALAERGLGRTTVSLRTLLSAERPSVGGRTTLRLADYAREIVASGLPGLRHQSGRTLRAHLDSYLARIVQRDFLEQGHRVRRPETLRRWMTAYAAATATVTTLDKIRAAATGGDGETPAKTTVTAYRDVLQELWVVEPLPGWLPTRNRLSRLAMSPKHHLVDPAFAARLLSVDAETLMAGGGGGPSLAREGTLFGNLFESLMTLSIRVYAQAAEARVYHLRERDGRHEVDMIVERADGRVVAIEIKLSATVDDHDVKHLLWLRQQLGDQLLDAVLVTTGSHAYRRPDGVAVLPAALLGP